jgi:hypothetical protein
MRLSLNFCVVSQEEKWTKQVFRGEDEDKTSPELILLQTPWIVQC